MTLAVDLEITILGGMHSSSEAVDRVNNFDLLRLCAAVTVMLWHISMLNIISGATWLGASFLVLGTLLPGVPIFFIISGFLITNSWLNKPDVGRYLKARALRIYPALIAATALLSVWLLYFGMWNGTWFINQFSIVWIYSTPQIMVPFGGGMPNGPLWTIPVEFKFYLLLPLLLWPLAKGRWTVNKTALLVAAVTLISLVLQINNDFGHHHRPDLRHGALHHFWFFGFGVLARLYWQRAQPFLSLPVWAVAHAVLTAVLWSHVAPGLTLGSLSINDISNTMLTLVMATTLPGLILSAAFTKPDLSDKILRGNDISYGIYIYHMIYLHAFAMLGFSSYPLAALVVGSGTVTAMVSWGFIEKPMLRLKSKATKGLLPALGRSGT